MYYRAAKKRWIMKNYEDSKTASRDSEERFSLGRERMKLRLMKWLLALLSVVLLLSLLLTLFANR